MKKIAVFIILLFSVYSLFFILGGIFAPALAHFHHYEISAKLTSIYMYSCHQRPERSFWLMGYPAALCCRCLGFYIGVFISGMIFIIKKNCLKIKYIIIIALLVFTDILTNTVFKLNTGNITRFISGIMMGLLFISFIYYIFNSKRRKRL